MAKVCILDIQGTVQRKDVWARRRWRFDDLEALVRHVAAVASTVPVLVFIHTSDVDELDANRAFSQEFLDRFEGRFSRDTPTAVVYFSGAPLGASHLSRFGKEMSRGYFHRFVAEERIDDATAPDFAERIVELANVWEVTLEENPTGAPPWELLDCDWLAEIVECLVSRQLGLSHNGAVALGRGRLAPEVVKAQAGCVGLTSDESGILHAALSDSADDLAAATSMLMRVGRQASQV